MFHIIIRRETQLINLAGKWDLAPMKTGGWKKCYTLLKMLTIRYTRGTRYPNRLITLLLPTFPEEYLPLCFVTDSHYLNIIIIENIKEI